MYIADSFNCRVRRIDAKSGLISNFAGTGQKSFGGDGGPAEKAQFGNIYCVAFDPKFERMYLADLDNRRIRAIDMKSCSSEPARDRSRTSRGVPSHTEEPFERNRTRSQRISTSRMLWDV